MFGHISIRSQQPNGSSKGCTFQLKCLRHHQMCSFAAIQPSISQRKIICKLTDSLFWRITQFWHMFYHLLNMLNCGGMRNDMEVLWHIPWIPCEFFVYCKCSFDSMFPVFLWVCCFAFVWGMPSWKRMRWVPSKQILKLYPGKQRTKKSTTAARWVSNASANFQRLFLLHQHLGWTTSKAECPPATSYQPAEGEVYQSTMHYSG